MKAMVLPALARVEQGSRPLVLADVPDPVPAQGELLLRVQACGVCHTELDEIEGRTPPSRLPRILGHQVIGRVEASRGDASGFSLGDRAGVAWIYSACGHCAYCLSGQENLCPDFMATGRDADGGYAEYMTVSAAFAHRIPEVFSDAQAAPLLCAGAVGYRSLRLAALEDGQALGFTGFGASGHLVLMAARQRYPRSPLLVFSRSTEERAFARDLGATWAGGLEDPPPEKLDAIIDTTPVWAPIVVALRWLKPGGRLIINAIRKEDVDKESLLRLDYAADLWLEKSIKSVANVTRQDVREFLELAARIPIRPEVQEFALSEANEALVQLRTRRIRGAKVLRVAS